MNNKVVVSIVIVLIILIGAGYWFTTRSKSTPSNSDQVSQTSPAPTAVPAAKSLRDLLSLGSAQKCTFTSGDASASAAGTIYVNSGKVRGDINTTVTGQAMVTHMIVSDNTSYIWIDGQTTGFKMSIDPSAKPSGVPSNPNFDPNKPLNYDCSGWTADSSLFNLPTNVKFSDFGKIAMPSVSVSGSPGNSDKCSSCSYLSGSAQTQCLAALGCSK